MDYHVAQLSNDDKQRLKQLEDELGVVLIAYEKGRVPIEGNQHFQRFSEEQLQQYLDDPNLNLL